MWTIVVIGVVTFANTIILWSTLYRIRNAEAFLMILSGVVLQSYDVDILAEYLKSRSSHPAGKRLPEERSDDRE